MRDLTKDSIWGHLFVLATPIVLSTVSQIVYQLVDLYFIAKMGPIPTAGVTAASTMIFVVSGFTQVLSVGTASLTAQAAGRKDGAECNMLLNQSFALSALSGAACVALLVAVSEPYLRLVVNDPATVREGVTFIRWVAPGCGLLFPLIALSASLRGTGTVAPAVTAFVITLVANTALAPILIGGWLTGSPLGAKGAGLATSLSTLAGVFFLLGYLVKVERYLVMSSGLMRPQLFRMIRVLGIGFPAGGEFLLTFLSTSAAYYAIGSFGASTQAAFGIGSRILQAVLLPSIAVALASAPIVGQNYGAKNESRVRATLRLTTVLVVSSIAVLTFIVQYFAESLAGAFGAADRTQAAAVTFLRIMSWSLVPQGVIYVFFNVLQGFGNMRPSLISSSVRFALFAVSVVVVSRSSQFHVEQVWYLLVASSIFQAGIGACMLRKEFRRRFASAVLIDPA